MEYTNNPELNASATYQFWCWKHKLQGVMQLLSLLSGYVYSEADADTVAYGLHPTNADKHQSFEYDLTSTHGQCRVILALDENNRDIVFVATIASTALQERIQFLARLQELLKTIEVDFT
ncbi:hypothetical protein [Hymenobacter metallilatus]|uniref:Uncharacterized protein n=1 Tax=Hymenobacter metallilatus TaxID=2493666 RepID=A0A428JCM3_9BACT|nr:hypothetical protein [Hymenobacter metallilatus]RSK29759.1 hypothetical protein EI290_15575 [Hymenobacter metallilatus]